MKSKLLMTHLVAGYPTIDISLKLAKTFITAGTDILEIQIPFSDPVADGPAIIAACHTALKQGSGYAMALEICREISGQTSVALVVMTYANIPFRIGFDTFCKTIKKYGATGLIVPDLPFDSQDGRALQLACKKHHVDLIQVVSPGIKENRLKQIIACSKGFIYCTTSRGITGRKMHVSKDLVDLLKKIKKHTDLPVAVGFGFSNKKDIIPLKKYADIFVFGSVFVRLLNARNGFIKIHRLVKSIKQSISI